MPSLALRFLAALLCAAPCARARIIGFSLDIEPPAGSESVALVNTLAAWRAALSASGTGLRLSADAGTAWTAAAYETTVNGTTKTLGEWLVDLCDETIIMSYDRNATNLLLRVEPFLQYAAARGAAGAGAITVGAAVSSPGDAEAWWRTANASELEALIAAVDGALQRRPQFSGRYAIFYGETLYNATLAAPAPSSIGERKALWYVSDSSIYDAAAREAFFAFAAQQRVVQLYDAPHAGARPHIGANASDEALSAQFYQRCDAAGIDVQFMSGLNTLAYDLAFIEKVNAAVAAAAPPPLAPPPPPHVDVFTAGEGGWAGYRIPSLVRTASGALVALAEARTGGDCDEKRVLSRRSTDGGATWSAPAVVFAVPGGSAGNPTAAYADGRVLVALALGNASACNPGQSMWLVDDGGSDGQGWGAPRDISAGLGAWAGALPGPGSMAVLPATSRWPRRLIFPAHNGAYVAAAAILSDDGGASWRVAAGAPLAAMDESAIAVAAANGSLLLNMRNRHANASCDCRAVARSEDGGERWSPISFDAALIEPVCQGSLVALNGSLFFSNPASKTERAQLTVRRSDDGGASWRAQTWLAWAPASAGYTCIAAGEPLGHDAAGRPLGGILFEASNAQGEATVSFRTFPLDLS